MNVPLATGSTASLLKAWPGAGLHGTGGTEVFSSRGIPLVGIDYRPSYEQIYKTQPWVYIVVNKLVRGIGRLPWQAFDRLNEGEAQEDRDSSLADLLHQPYPRCSPSKFKQAMIGNICLHGNFTGVYDRPTRGAPPTEIWPVPFRYMNAVRGTDRPISHWLYRGPAGEKIFLPEDVLHVKWWDGDDDVVGTSPLEPLRRTLALEDAGQRAAVSVFANGLRPSGAAKYTGKRNLTPEEKAEIRAELEGTHGGPDRQFRVAILEGGLDWEPMQHTAQEAEMIPHRKLNREEVCAAFDLNPTQVGILDRATFSNVSEAHRNLYQDTYGQWTTPIEEEIEVQLIRPEASWTGKFVEFDYAEVLKGSHAERAAYYSSVSDIMTPNEKRKAEGLAPIDHPLAKAIYVPLNSRPVGVGVEEFQPTVEQTEQEQQLEHLAALLAPRLQATVLNGG